MRLTKVALKQFQTELRDAAATIGAVDVSRLTIEQRAKVATAFARRLRSLLEWLPCLEGTPANRTPTPKE